MVTLVYLPDEAYRPSQSGDIMTQEEKDTTLAALAYVLGYTLAPTKLPILFVRAQATRLESALAAMKCVKTIDDK